MSINLYLIWALLLAALVPLALIATRHELRKVRFRVVQDLRNHLFADAKNLPQLELAAARYRSAGDANGHSGETRQSLVRIWTGAIIFIATSFVGFALLLVPRASLLPARDARFPQLTDALLWGAQTPTGPLDDIARTVTILAVAFLGGYVFQIRYLVRATLNQELGALAFVRATVSLIQGMIIALIGYRAATAAGVSEAPGFAGALAIAFVIGFLPNIGIARLSQLAGIRHKTVDEAALAVSKLVPLEVIEGIDQETAYRLEETNLFDVQNLATQNPICLYAETPFGLLQIFDWVLQAQLCANVGTQAFQELKKHKIRTIFDLERAVLAQGAPEDYVRALGEVIFVTASKEFRQCVGLPPTPGEAPLAGVRISADTVKHAVAIMSDDLHVHRLRALWRIMLKTTAGVDQGDSPWLFDTGSLPGDCRLADPPLRAPADEYVRLAIHYGDQYAVLRTGPADAAVLQAKRAEALDAIRRATDADPAARERLRRQWAPEYLRKRREEVSLEPFRDDPDFRQLLDVAA